MSIKSFITIIFLFLCILPSCTIIKYNHDIKPLDGKSAKPHVAAPNVQVIKTIYVDARFNQDQRAMVMDATEEWQTYSNGLVQYHVEYDYEVKLTKEENKILIVYLEPEEEITKAFDSNIHGIFTAGYIKEYNVEYILLCPARIGEKYYLKIAIERQLGHNLGLKDIASELPAVMNEKINDRVPCPTENDMRAFCAQYLCTMDQVKYCVVK